MNQPTSSDVAYTGTDNLEVMAEAIRYNNFLVELVRRRAGLSDVLLDFGAGVGTFARELTRSGHRVLCVEPDPAQAARIREAGLDVFPSADKLEDASVDFAYSFNVLEHIGDDVGALKVLFSKLRPGGTLLVYVPAFDLLVSSMDHKVGHLRRYRRGELRRKVAAAGFTMQFDRYVDCLGFFATLAYKVAGPKDGAINVPALVFYDRYLFPISRLLDRALGRLIGKNVLLVATRPSTNAAGRPIP